MSKLSALCVYCGSAVGGDSRYRAAATALGRLLAERGVRLVFGGGRVGLMGTVADAAVAGGGRVHGIIPRHLERYEVGHRDIESLEVVETMHQRKMRMFEESDAFCVLPGGLGTLDEMFEMVTWRQLGLHEKPVVLLNVAGFWDPLLALIRHQAAEGFVRAEHLPYLRVAQTPEQVLEEAGRAPAPTQPLESKWA